MPFGPTSLRSTFVLTLLKKYSIPRLQEIWAKRGHMPIVIRFIGIMRVNGCISGGNLIHCSDSEQFLLRTKYFYTIFFLVYVSRHYNTGCHVATSLCLAGLPKSCEHHGAIHLSLSPSASEIEAKFFSQILQCKSLVDRVKNATF